MLCQKIVSAYFHFSFSLPLSPFSFSLPLSISGFSFSSSLFLSTPKYEFDSSKLFSWFLLSLCIFRETARALQQLLHAENPRLQGNKVLHARPNYRTIGPLSGSSTRFLSNYHIGGWGTPTKQGEHHNTLYKTNIRKHIIQKRLINYLVILFHIVQVRKLSPVFSKYILFISSLSNSLHI